MFGAKSTIRLRTVDADGEQACRPERASGLPIGEGQCLCRVIRSRGTDLHLTDDIARTREQLDLSLRRRVAEFALTAVALELMVVNAVFIIYSWAGKHWDVPTPAMTAWLAATIVEVIGIVKVIAGSLFCDAQSTRPE
jgi:hypothetical protein